MCAATWNSISKFIIHSIVACRCAAKVQSRVLLVLDFDYIVQAKCAGMDLFVWLLFSWADGTCSDLARSVTHWLVTVIIRHPVCNLNYTFNTSIKDNFKTINTFILLLEVTLIRTRNNA